MAPAARVRALPLVGLVLLALAACAAAAPVAPLASTCGGTVAFPSLVFTPALPVAGDLVSLTATGAARSAVAGGAGNITASLWGSPVFEGAVNTIGVNQTLDIEGIVSLTFNGFDAPLAAGAPAELSFSIVVPSIAEGMGAIGVIINATDGGAAGNAAVCLNLTLTF